MTRQFIVTLTSTTILGATLVVPSLDAQGGGQQVVLDRLRTMPGYEQYTQMQDALRTGGPAFVSGALTVNWDKYFGSGSRRTSRGKVEYTLTPLRLRGSAVSFLHDLPPTAQSCASTPGEYNG